MNPYKYQYKGIFQTIKDFLNTNSTGRKLMFFTFIGKSDEVQKTYEKYFNEHKGKKATVQDFES